MDESKYDFLGDELQPIFKAEELSIPYLVPIQTNSPCVNPAKPGYLKDAKPGMFLVTGLNLLFDKVALHILDKEVLWVEWDEKRIVRTYPPNSFERQIVKIDDKTKYLNPATGFEVVETYYYYVVLENQETPVPLIFPLTKTAIKYAKKWNSSICMAKMPDGSPAFLIAPVWEINLVLNEKDGHSWFNIGKDGATSIKATNRYITKDFYESIAVPAKDGLKAIKERKFELPADVIENAGALPYDGTTVENNAGTIDFADKF